MIGQSLQIWVSQHLQGLEAASYGWLHFLQGELDKEFVQLQCLIKNKGGRAGGPARAVCELLLRGGAL